MTINIRPMLRKDKPTLMRILRNTPEFKPAEVVIAEEVIDSCLSDPKGSGYFGLVAEEDSTVVGYACYGTAPLTEDTWDLYWIAVDGDRQGQGIGGRLTAVMEGEIKKARGRMIIVETSSIPSYEKTRRFYLKRGYQIVACIPDFYSPGDDKVIFQKLLK